MATATKKKPTKKVVEEEKDALDEEIEVFENVALSVERVLEHPETGEQKTFHQQELGFIPKTKFFRLASGTLRLATTQEQGVNSLIDGMFGDAADLGNEDILLGIMKLVELSPDFLEEAFLYALNVRPADRPWVYECLDTIDDDTGLDIIDVFIGQNAPAIKRFLPKIQKIGKRVQALMPDTEQE